MFFKKESFKLRLKRRKSRCRFKRQWQFIPFCWFCELKASVTVRFQSRLRTFNFFREAEGNNLFGQFGIIKDER